MNVASFFDTVDETLQGNQLEAKAKQAQEREFIKTTKHFATKLSATINQYVIEFEKRGFKCQEQKSNLPYWSFEIKNANGGQVKIAIVNSEQNKYEIAFYENEKRINALIHISDDFNQEKIDTELQKLFKKII